MSGPYLLNIFLNDIGIEQSNSPALFKYADGGAIVATVQKFGKDPSVDLVGEFLAWAS